MDTSGEEPNRRNTHRSSELHWRHVTDGRTYTRGFAQIQQQPTRFTDTRHRAGKQPSCFQIAPRRSWLDEALGRSLLTGRRCQVTATPALAIFKIKCLFRIIYNSQQQQRFSLIEMNLIILQKCINSFTYFVKTLLFVFRYIHFYSCFFILFIYFHHHLIKLLFSWFFFNTSENNINISSSRLVPSKLNYYEFTKIYVTKRNIKSTSFRIWNHFKQLKWSDNPNQT